MSLFTNEDGIFQKCFGFLGKLIALNFIWMLCSLPLITIGASTTALYYSVLKLHKYGDCSYKDYIKSFKQNFKQGTVIWILLCGIAGTIIFLQSKIGLLSGLVSMLSSYGIFVGGLLLFLVTIYIFPTLAAFDNSIKKLVGNAFYFSVRNILYTIAIAVITIMPMFFTMVDAKFFPIYVFVWLLCGFSFTSYVNAWFFYKMFKPHLENGTEDMSTSGQQYVA